MTCVWMCGTEYGGGGVDERRYLFGNAFTGPLPAELGELANKVVRAARPRLAMWGQLLTRSLGWVSRFTGAAG